MANSIHVPPDFYRKYETLCEALEDAAEAFEDKLAQLVISLNSYRWDGHLPIKQHGHTGRDFSCRIDDEFTLVFRRETDRDGEGHPLHEHLYLLTLERSRSSISK